MDLIEVAEQLWPDLPVNTEGQKVVEGNGLRAQHVYMRHRRLNIR